MPETEHTPGATDRGSCRSVPPPPNDGIRLSTTVTVLLLASGVLVSLAVADAGRSCGAPRSVQLKFQERQAAIEQVVAAEDARGE